jgi:microcin C transport system permease protein
MTEKHIVLVVLAILLFDPVRNNLWAFLKRFGLPITAVGLGVWLFILLPATMKLILVLGAAVVFRTKLMSALSLGYHGIVGYFTSPIFLKRAKKFKTMKRGYYSFVIIVSLYVLSFGLPLMVTNQALVVKYENSYYFPAVKGFFNYYFSRIINPVLDIQWDYYEKDFGGDSSSPVNFRKLQERFKDSKENWVVMSLYPYSPNESNMEEYDKNPPNSPDLKHWLGTDDRGRDVLARLFYGFNISLSFALIVCVLAYIVGITVGGYLGYYGGWFDIVVQRIVELWSAVPFLYTVMIVVSIMDQSSMLLLICLLASFGWMAMTYYIRGEFLREKAKDYVSAAISIGVKDHVIIFRHILPNALTPVISFLPFTIVAQISSLVSLDFLGFGLPAPTPSWGELMHQALGLVRVAPWLAFAPMCALFLTLLLVSFVGEAVREAFDPKQYSRLR